MVWHIDQRPQALRVERNGKFYTAVYRVERGIVTVSTTVAQRATHIGGISPEALARQLLRELIDAGAADEEKPGP